MTFHPIPSGFPYMYMGKIFLIVVTMQYTHDNYIFLNSICLLPLSAMPSDFNMWTYFSYVICTVSHEFHIAKVVLPNTVIKYICTRIT